MWARTLLAALLLVWIVPTHVSTGEPDLSTLRILNGNVEFCGVRLGMTEGELTKLTNRWLDLEPQVHPRAGKRASIETPCGMIDVTIEESTGLVVAIDLALKGAFTKEEIVGAIRKRVATLRYEPSIHQPDLPEDKNDIPNYLFDEKSPIRFVVRQPTGLWIIHKDWAD